MRSSLYFSTGGPPFAHLFLSRLLYRCRSFGRELANDRDTNRVDVLRAWYRFGQGLQAWQKR